MNLCINNSPEEYAGGLFREVPFYTDGPVKTGSTVPTTALMFFFKLWSHMLFFKVYTDEVHICMLVRVLCLCSTMFIIYPFPMP